MKFLKALVLIILILAGVWVVLCLIGPAELNVSRSTVMKAPPNVIYKEVADFTNWSDWSPWAGEDSTMVTTVSGPPSGEGAIMEWTSENSGDGRQVIASTDPNEMIQTVLTFSNMPGEHKADWFFESAEGEGTKVTWTMNSAEVPFLMRGVLTLFGGVSLLEDQYDQGLADLTRVVESKPTFEPEITDSEGFWYIGVEADSVTAEMLANGNMHAKAYMDIQQFMKEKDMVTSGMPVTFTRKYDDGIMDLTFALPVADSTGVSDGLVIDHVPPGRVAAAMHQGPYETVGQTWNQFDPYFEAHPASFRYYPYEQYINDPADVEDSTAYLTRIVYPLN